MMLQWTSHDHIIGTQTAVGMRGVYSVQRVGPEWILQGQGHDGLTMLAIPVEGKAFASLDSAKTWAGELDRVRSVEPQVSGS
ncbi:hypothetical protein BTO20_05845 [Mycobacterium dioxanotrophicus]|uniref:Uncharacterized protein n=2 Tax=Mycobacterium dioxanotrophicus TaxID=482462 RepID=A0A1Y0BZ32_9MYCO|nr:hypothetical protein BTO20_05845 [Mycobacterium dioxanotrophicus]